MKLQLQYNYIEILKRREGCVSLEEANEAKEKTKLNAHFFKGQSTDNIQS